MLLKNVISEALGNVDKNDVVLDFPPEKLRDKFDISTNVPMLFAKELQQNPEDIAKTVILKLNNLDNKLLIPELIEFTNPGFLNIKMSKDFWENSVLNIDGFDNIWCGKKINIEFVSANPTGPMHIGHVRGAIYGDVLARLLERAGFDVTREFYINDAGKQIDILIKSFLFRLDQVKKKDFSEKIPDGCYPGEYLIDAAREFVISDKNNDADLSVVRSFAIKFMIDLISKDLKNLNRGKEMHNKFSSEDQIIAEHWLDKAFKKLKQKGLIYKGILDIPKGKLLEDWEEREQDLFKSTDFGDDIDRPLKKSDGSYTYFAGDVGYHYNKISRGFDQMILVLGTDHKGYKKRISAAIDALSDGNAKIDVKLCELVNFLKNGEPVKMSKRAGNFLLASDVLNEVDSDIIRFIMLTRKNDTLLNFDFEKVKEQSKNNPVFYVQYAFARCCSIERKAIEKFQKIVNLKPDLSNQMNRELAIKLCFYSQVVRIAIKKYEPHLLVFYVIDLASMFHSIWNNGVKFVEDDFDKTMKNVSFVLLIKNIIKDILDICGIKPKEEI